MSYFERLTPTRWPADAHIQTACDPLTAAAEFSWNHPDFAGLLEVSVQGVVAGRPVLSPVLVRVKGPGRCFLAPVDATVLATTREMA
ncbi:MAG: hypothetical protein AB2385_11455 [Symbiobacterium sp.]|uniref:hypothetical protein n=1 Tax=Symbiobacterium sp. TaxID=1971213 RepID=UPI00346457A7